MPSLVLILMRHGHAEEAKRGDHARRLSAVGLAEARATAHRLLQGGWRPSLVLASDAARTTETCRAVCDILAPAPTALPVELRADLYSAGSATVLATVTAVDVAKAACVMVVGHNPAMSDVVSMLTSRFDGLGTGEAAVLSTNAASWGEALREPSVWTLQNVVRPGR